MKTKLYLLLILSFLFVGQIFAQDFSKLDDIVMKDKSDYALYDGKVLECANYLMNLPEGNNTYRMECNRFLIRWMSGTPDYSFDLDDTITKISKSDSDLLMLYMAAMVKFTLENKDEASDKNAVKYNSIVTLLNYCENPDNNVKLSNELKKMIKAKTEGKLKEYLHL